MEKRSALNFVVRIRSSLLHEFLQQLVDRAYMLGHEDGANGAPADSSRVQIDPSLMRKLQR